MIEDPVQSGRQHDEGEARVRPPGELLGKPRHVGHRQRGGSREFDGEIAVGHGVDRIAAKGFEPELVGHALAVDREARAGERGASQRQPVHAPATIGESLGVAREHGFVGEQMVTEGDRLRDLQVGIAGHDRAGVRLRQVDERAPQAGQASDERVDRPAQPQAQIGRDLVVARASGVQPLAGFPDQRREAMLDVEMDVLEVARPGKFAALDFAAQGFHAALDCGEVVPGKHAGRGQHPRVRQRSGDVGGGEAAIEIHRRGVTLDERGDRLAEATGPGFGGRGIARRLGVGHGNRFGFRAGRECVAAKRRKERGQARNRRRGTVSASG
jgi:hypothetical protein